MDLFLLRHAVAEPHRPGLADADRPLTADGRRRFEAEVRGLERLGLRFDRLLHSPWLRAAETAELAMPLVDGDAAVADELAMAPGPALLALLTDERLALVGHEPWLSELAAWLTVGSPAHGASLALKKGALVWLRGEPQPGHMVVRAHLPPRVLRALG
jgi:phosphohistidine phosphatase